MQVRRLESFFAVADELHFGRAAERLHRSQAAVSEGVRELEVEFGHALFERTTRRVALTPFGERVLARLRPHFEHLTAEYRSIASEGQRAGVRIAHTPELGQFILPHWVAGLIDREPEAHDLADAWSVRVLHTARQLDAVRDGDIDLGVCWQPRPMRGVEIVRLARVQVVLMISQRDSLAGAGATDGGGRDAEHAPIEVGSLRDRRVLVSPAHHNPAVDAVVRRTLVAAGLNAAQCTEVQGYEDIALGVASGAGVGMHPVTIAAINRVPGVAFRPIADAPEAAVDICCVRRAGHSSVAVEQAIELLSDAVQHAMETVPGALR